MVARVDRTRRIAEMLREARERMGVGVERAASDSGIPAQYIRLLEGETTVRVGIADELYLIPYFRRYAAFLGLDAPELVSEFLSQLRPLPSPSSAVPVTFDYPSRLRWLWKPAAIVAVVLIAASLIAQQSPERPTFDDEGATSGDRVWSDADKLVARDDATVSDNTGHEPQQQPLESRGENRAASDESAVAPEPRPADPAGSVDVGVASIPSSDSGARNAPGGRELRVTAAEETWLAIDVDDQTSTSVLLQPGETRTWTAQAGFTLTIGNAGGIVLTLDGRELPRLGASGQVVRKLRLPGEMPPPSG